MADIESLTWMKMILMEIFSVTRFWEILGWRRVFPGAGIRNQMQVGNSSDVMFDTEASKLVLKKRHISHWNAVLELDSFCQKLVIYDIRSLIHLKAT